MGIRYEVIKLIDEAIDTQPSRGPLFLTRLREEVKESGIVMAARACLLLEEVAKQDGSTPYLESIRADVLKELGKKNPQIADICKTWPRAVRDFVDAVETARRECRNSPERKFEHYVHGLAGRMDDALLAGIKLKPLMELSGLSPNETRMIQGHKRAQGELRRTHSGAAAFVMQ